MHLTLRHATRYAYSPRPARVALRIKLFPQTTEAQTVAGWHVSVNGQVVGPMLTDAAGDAEGLWLSRDRIETVEIVASGELTTRDTAGLLRRQGFARPGLYLRDTRATKPDPAIRKIAEATLGPDPLSSLHALNEAVHGAIAYRKGVTDETTTAAQALALGAGVCQDLAQIFVSAARAMGRPARYVVGYLHDPDSPLSETHAWAEAHVEGLGWVGFDPTHKLCPTAAYIRLASGFDAADAAPIRGNVTGAAEETLDVAVEIAQVQGQSQS